MPQGRNGGGNQGCERHDAQQAEEKAAKLGVKLVFPIFFCILPSLFVVTVGPVAVKIVRELIPMMNSI